MVELVNCFESKSNNKNNIHQVAVICPTTFLANQHYKQFCERFKEFPDIKIALLTRHVSQKDANIIKEKLENGEIHIIIGTHAIFNSSLKFKQLNLLIIDEEQSFGVEQKEKLKLKWPNCHFLTLSATPIPRTLQSALYGVMDTSILSTPPVNRLPTKNFFLSYDEETIGNAIKNELNIAGRVVFLTQKIENIPEIEMMIRKLNIENIKFTSVHGRLDGNVLDDIMTKFCEGEYNLLISTTILAQGMNIPNLNTIIIHNADQFGLGQLYQIKGRVGRADIQGYVYFLIDKKRMINDNVKRRLQIIESSAEFGGGFAVSNADLDIRGSGNILGKEQSGNIKEIGFDLYQEMLNSAIIELNKDSGVQNNEYLENIKNDFIPEINIGKSIHISDYYINDVTLKIEFYRRISKISSEQELINLKLELQDRFGRIPQEINNLFDVIKVKILCYKYLIDKFSLTKNNIVLEFTKFTKINVPKLLELIKIDKEISIKNNNVIVINNKSKILNLQQIEDNNVIKVEILLKKLDENVLNKFIDFA